MAGGPHSRFATAIISSLAFENGLIKEDAENVAFSIFHCE